MATSDIKTALVLHQSENLTFAVQLAVRARVASISFTRAAGEDGVPRSNTRTEPRRPHRLVKTSAPHLALLLEPLLEDSLSQSARRTARSARRLVSGESPDDVRKRRGRGSRGPTSKPQQAPAGSDTHGEHGRSRHLGY